MKSELEEKFGFSGEQAIIFYKQIDSYWNLGGTEFLPEGVSIGKVIYLNNNEEIRFMHVKDTTLYIKIENGNQGFHIYCELYGEPEKRRKAKSLLGIMSTIEIK